MDAFLDDGKTRHRLSPAVTVIGRDQRSCNLCFQDDLLSRRHCYIVRQGPGEWILLDMNSSNGVHVNGRKVEYQPLKDGDKVELGGTEYLFRLEGAATPAFDAAKVPGKAAGRGDPMVPATSILGEGGPEVVRNRESSNAQAFVRALREPTVVLQAAQVKTQRTDFDKLLILYKVTRLVTSETDLDRLLSRVSELAMEVLKADRVSIMFRTRDGLVPKVQKSGDRKEIESGLLHISQSISEYCLERREPVITQDALIDKRFQRSGSIQMYNIRSAMCSPLLNKDEPFGVLYVDNRLHGDCFDEDDLRLLEAFADSVSIAIVNSRLIYELRKSLSQVKQQQEALVQGEKLAAMGQLSAGISHEIRGPLTAISGYVQLYFAKFPAGSPFFDKMQRIQDSLETINGIVHGLLDLARKSEGRMEACDVAAIIEATLKVAEHTLSKVGAVKVVRELADSLPAVFADRRQIQQVFLNMMLNAAQAMPQGGTLTISARPGPRLQDGRASVDAVFSDTGVGIPEEFRGQIFQPFFTRGKKGGTGLGLAICKNIVDAHAGSILLESEVGKGTTFTIRLPAQGAGVMQPENRATASSSGSISGDMSSSWGEIATRGSLPAMDSTSPKLDLDAEPSISSTKSGGVLITNLAGSDPGKERG